MIEVEGVFKNYGRIKALQGVSFVAKPGVVTGLLGPNGCGKTTLIKNILGLVPMDKGAIRVNGQLVNGDSAYRHQLGYMPQNPDFPANLKVAEILSMLEDIRGMAGIYKEELCHRFNIVSVLNRPFGNLSGGTKQKVAAIAAMMFDSCVLILDEPTVGLDPISVVTIRELTQAAADKGHTVLLVSHVMSEIELLSKQLVFLLDGREVFSGSIEQICDEAGESQLDNAIVTLMQDFVQKTKFN